jgi:penicillin-binding protein 2
LAGPEYSESVGELWTAGAALAAAIGQQNNAFTPIQMLMYCSAFANGGIRYKTTILKEIRDYYTGEVVLANDPVVLGEANISESTMDVIREGMRNVVTKGTAGWYFRNFPIDIAGKTGTAETSNVQDNALFCTYAPYDDPEIAVMVVMESGESSLATIPVIKDLFTEYFLNSNDKFTPDTPNTVLP